MKAAQGLLGAFLGLVLSVQASAAIKVPINRDPAFNPSLNPAFNTSINPDFNFAINPKFSSTLNPDYNPATNPRFNTGINPRFNADINPRFNTKIDPRFTPELDPKLNWEINPERNLSPNIPVTFWFSRQGTAMYYVVEASLNVAIAFDAGAEPRRLLITDASGGYNVFDFERLEWLGYLKTNGAAGFNVFSLDAAWVGFTE